MAITLTGPTTSEAPPPGFQKLLLRSYNGLTYRDVSTKPARDCTEDEIPIIDLSGMFGDLEEQKVVAADILRAAEYNGFFYIKNHGIPIDLLNRAHGMAKQFFKLPIEEKSKLVSNTTSYGYHGLRQRQVNPSESKDRKESFSCHYEPMFDPSYCDRLDQVPQHVWDRLPKDSFLWDQDLIPGFRDAVIPYWQACLATARRLIKLVALAMDLPAHYFDRFTTYPGADMALNFYPGHGEHPVEDLDEVGIGAHTDLQILTLLWQDEHKGLQVLNKQNEWVFAPPIEKTLVVNIGDFLMRLTNDRLQSTVHRVLQHGKEDRFSIPFFFGFNFDEKLGVVPTCVDENNPSKYEPVTCGELITERLALGAEPVGPSP